MLMKQLSVFLENREGRLQEVMQILADADINIISLSLADTSDYGMLRLLVSDPSKGKETLRNNGVSCTLTDILAIKMEHQVGTLQAAIAPLYEADLNIEYMYALSTGTNDAAIAIKPSNLEKAVKVLTEAGVKFFGEGEQVQ